MSLCPLCQKEQSKIYFEGQEEVYMAKYWLCHHCDLVYLDPALLLNNSDEKERYELHENEDTPGYRKFLNKLASKVIEHTLPGNKGLDFGCGPSIVMSKIFYESSRQQFSFDPYFYPDEGLLTQTYDFITCSEVIEHMYRPYEILQKLVQMLAPQGVLGIMTTFRCERSLFDNWWYKKDPTHICFYSPKTFQFIANSYCLDVVHLANNVALFKKR